MNINKLAPWNWFKKEEEMDGAALPAKRTEAVSPADPFEQMRQEIDRLFAGFYQGS